MVAKWIAGAENLVDERIAYANARGLSPRVGAAYRLPESPWRKVWHTMEAPEDDPDTTPDEGWSLEQLRSYIIGHRVPPHLWAAPLHDHVFQTVPLDLSAYALVHREGDPETNHRHAIQTEVCTYASRGLTDPELCEWLGRRILRPVLDAGVPIDLTRIAPSTGSDGYGTDGAVRQTWTWWTNFTGNCGHANVPGNVHWDPGRARYDLIAQAAAREPLPPTPAPETEDDDDMFVVHTTSDPVAWAAIHGSKMTRLVSTEDINTFKTAAEVFAVTQAQWDNFSKACGGVVKP
jgi:hypothetical protein